MPFTMALLSPPLTMAQMVDLVSSSPPPPLMPLLSLMILLACHQWLRFRRCAGCFCWPECFRPLCAPQNGPSIRALSYSPLASSRGLRRLLCPRLAVGFYCFFLIGETQENFVVVEGVRVVRVQWYCLCIVLRAMYSTGNFSKLRSARTSYRYRRVLRRDPLALVSPGSWRGHHFSGAVVAVAVMAVLGTVEEARAFHLQRS